MCHTPVREYEFKNLDKCDPANLDFTVVLGAGQRGHISEHLLKNYNIKPNHYITLEEYAAIFPEITYFVRYEFQNKSRLDWLKQNCLSRFNIDVNDLEKIEKFRKNLKVTAIVTWDFVSQEGLANQIFSDIVASRDGRAIGERRRTQVDDATGEVTCIDP